MKLIITLLLSLIGSASFSQIEFKHFIEFIDNQPNKECLASMDSLALVNLFRSKVIRVNNHSVTLNDSEDETVTIDPFGLCNEYRTITYHYFEQNGKEYMFVYKRYSVSREDYGELQLYEKNKETWEFGRTLTFDWQNFFSISKEEIDRLRNLNQYPKYLVSFKKEGIEFSIPWETYSFDQGSEINGYVKGNGSQPILLEYEEIIR